jgi:hypothetical protein
MEQQLREVIANGQPAHADEARRLLDRLSADPGDEAAAHAAAALVEAYLHDPHLTRYPSDSG